MKRECRRQKRAKALKLETRKTQRWPEENQVSDKEGCVHVREHVKEIKRRKAQTTEVRPKIGETDVGANHLTERHEKRHKSWDRA